MPPRPPLAPRAEDERAAQSRKRCSKWLQLLPCGSAARVRDGSQSTQRRNWSDQLDALRAAELVGRAEERARFEAFLADASLTLWHLYGPAGIGKSALLKQLASIAGEQGTRVAVVDLRWRDPSAAARDEIVALAQDAKLLVMDNLDRHAGRHAWLRDVVLPGLPDGVRVLSASRAPLGRAWAGERWAARVRQHALTGLRREESLEYLARRGIASRRRAAIARLAGGHPLSLALAAELALGGERLDIQPGEGTRELTERALASLGSEVERRAMYLCALARTVDEQVLRGALGVANAERVLSALRRHAFVESAPAGATLHDLVREWTLVELARHPDERAALVDALSAHLLRAIGQARGPALERLVMDLLYALREEPGAWFTLRGPGAHFFDRVREGERGDVLRVIRENEGKSSLALAERWHVHAPDGMLAVRDDDGGLTGFVHYIDLPASGRDLGPRGRGDAPDGDPVVAAVRERFGAGASVRVARYWFAMEGYQGRSGPNIAHAQILAHMARHLVADPDIAVGLSIHRDPAVWKAWPANPLDHFADVHVGEVELGLFGVDRRRMSFAQWIEKLAHQIRTGPGAPLFGAARAPREPAAWLSQDEHARWVRQALKDFHSDDKLRASPLTRSAAVRARAEADRTDPVAALRALLRDACDALGTEGEDAEHARVIETTFFEAPPRKQRDIAASLSMSFSTYRRRLEAAAGRVPPGMWSAEHIAIHELGS